MIYLALVVVVAGVLAIGALVRDLRLDGYGRVPLKPGSPATPRPTDRR